MRRREWEGGSDADVIDETITEQVESQDEARRRDQISLFEQWAAVWVVTFGLAVGSCVIEENLFDFRKVFGLTRNKAEDN